LKAKPAPPPQPKDAHERKAINDAVRLHRSLAQMRGRNAEWAEAAVREAASLSASDALGRGVIDLLADDVTDLLAKLDGREVRIGGGNVRLSTSGPRSCRLRRTGGPGCSPSSPIRTSPIS
jgi:membrane-bound serine protease (ClpP class)